jgi:O-antigen/teichoic acid export membrane protein
MKSAFTISAFGETFSTSLSIQVCALVQGIMIARLLGVTGRGDFAAIIMYPTLFAAVGIAGVNVVLTRVAAKNSESLFRLALLSAVATSVPTMLIGYWLQPILLSDVSKKVLYLSQCYLWSIPLNHLGLNLNAIEQGRGNLHMYNLTRGLLNPVYLGVIIAAYWFHFISLAALTWGLILANLVVVLVRFFYSYFKNRQFPGGVYPESVLKILRQGFRFGLAGGLQIVYQQFDKMLVLWLLNTEMLGVYTVALTAGSVLGSITTSAGIVIFSVSSQAANREGFGQLSKTFRVSLLLWAVFGVMLMAALPLLLPLVYGKAFAPAIIPAQLLIVGAACSGLSSLLDQAIRGQGKAFTGVWGRIAAIFIIAAIGYLLAPVYSASGMAIAFSIGQFGGLLVMIVQMNRHYPGARIRDYLPTCQDCKSLFRLFQSLSMVIRKRLSIS